MATVTIYPTAIPSASWTLFGVGNGVTALSDNNAATGYNNYVPNTPRSVKLISTASKPANMVGATITQVRIYLGGLVTSPSAGDFSAFVDTATSTTQSFGVATGQTNPFVNITAHKSWTDADFYVSTTNWGFSHAGNSDNNTIYRAVTECYLEVTYTPVSTPVAAFTVSTTTGTQPLNVQFTDQGSNTPTSWLWSFGDGNTAASQHPLYIYTTVGTYTVTLTETNGGGSTSLSTASLINVTTAAAPVAAEFNASPLSGVANLGVQFTDYSSGTPAPNAWLWTFGDSATSTAQHPLHTYTTVGTYTVTLTASNATPTTDTKTRTSFISVGTGLPIPAAAASTTTGVRPLTVEFTGSATNAQPNEWFWDFGDSASSAAQSPTHVFQTIGTYTPLLTVTNALGTATTTTGPITVGFATITASFTAAPLMGYVPLTVRFTDESIGDVSSWSWSFGDGEIDNAHQYPVHVYATSPTTVAVQTVTQEAQSYSSDLATGLINYWKMEETTGTGDRTDFIGSNNLTPTASVTQVAGKHDFATLIPSGVTVLQRASGFTWTSAYSFTCWIKWVSPGVAILIGGDSSGTSAPLGLTGGKLILYTTPTHTGATSLTADTWYHVVLTYDGDSSYKCYLNGVLETSGSDAANYTAVGINVGPTNSNMTVDEMGHYNIELGQSQITALYNSGSGLFFDPLDTTDSESSPSIICAMAPDRTWGMFFEELKYQLMEPVYELDVCEGFDAYGGMEKAVSLTHKRLQRFVLETGALRKEGTLAAATTDTEDFALPTDLIELLRVEVDGVPYYPSDPYQRDMDTATGYYIVNDTLGITIPGTFGATPVVKVWYTFVPAAPTVPAPCTCPSTPGTGPWANFPLPYVLWWAIRYGVMADMLNQAGERNDPERAGELEKLFGLGVSIYNLLYRSWS